MLSDIIVNKFAQHIPSHSLVIILHRRIIVTVYTLYWLPLLDDFFFDIELVSYKMQNLNAVKQQMVLVSLQNIYSLVIIFYRLYYANYFN